MNEAVLLHRVYDQFQIFPATGHVFKDNSVLDRFAFKEKITHRERTEQPIFNTSTLHILHVGDVIPIWSGLFAVYRQSEGVEDIPLPLMESALQHLLTTAQIYIIHPAAVQFLE